MPRRSSFRSPIRYVREAAGLNQAEFAERIGVSKFHLQDLELGTRAVTDRVAAAVALRWGLSAKSLVGERSRPALDDGAEIIKPSSDSDVRAWFRTFPDTRYRELNAVVPKAVEDILSRIGLLFRMAASQQSAVLLYADLRRWLANAEEKLRMPAELPELEGRETEKSQEGGRLDEVDAIRFELYALAAMDSLVAAIVRQMKENISRPNRKGGRRRRKPLRDVQ